MRRRFWEKVLRNVDASGTTAQLRTQLKIVFDAAKETAKDDLGNVVPADFIYNEIATDLFNTGMLQREYHETIAELADKSREGQLKSRLCALIFLISKLPREAGADDGVRATAGDAWPIFSSKTLRTTEPSFARKSLCCSKSWSIQAS